MAFDIKKVRASKIAKKMQKNALSFGQGEVDKIFSEENVDEENFSLRDFILSKFGSIENLKDQAFSGQDCEAQQYLSMVYEEGIPELGIEIDFDKAIHLLESASKNGDNSTSSLLYLAILHDRQGTIPHQLKAFELYLKAAKLGHIIAEFNLGEMYQHGVVGVVNKDVEEAFKWYRRAAGEEFQECDVKTVSHPSYRVEGNVRSLLVDLKFLALKHLFKYYMCGDCPEGEPQPVKALYYLKKAAELGDPEAQKDLGLAYLTGGSGHPKDLDKAKRWLGKAARNGEQEDIEVLEKVDAENIIEPETDPLDALSAVRQYLDIMQMDMNKNKHPYLIPEPMIFQESMFTKFPESPTAQHYLKAFQLVKQGLEIIQESKFNDTRGITLFAQGFLYETSIGQSFPLTRNYSFICSVIVWIDVILESNPLFFEGLVMMLALYPGERHIDFESSKLDLRKTMVLSNLIHLIKKAEPDKPPKKDPYYFEEDYTSWLHELYYLLGSNYIITQCYKDGAEAFDIALKCCPNYFKAKLPLGHCLMNLKFTKHQGEKFKANPTEKLLEMFAIPKKQRTLKGDYLSWTEVELVQKAKELFMEYLEQAPECDKKYQDGFYHLAVLYRRKGDLKEAVKWKEKGEDSEEKRLPFMGPLDLGTKKYLAGLDMLPNLKNTKTCGNNKYRNKTKR